MKTVQSLTLVMMVVMVYTKAIHNGTLGEIHDYAEELKKLTENETIMVTKISSDQNGPCVKEFFCLAEKALEKAKDLFKNETQTTRDTMDKLKRALHVYNKKHVHICNRNTTETYHLQKFLEEVMECSSHKKKNVIA